jgi:hypothetical protein
VRRLAALGLVIVVSSVWVAADEMSVQVDPRATLSLFRTFALRAAEINSDRPELDNTLFVKKLGNTIRMALTARGLNEVADGPDLFVDYRLTGEDVSTSARGFTRGMGPRPLRFTQGTLVIDLTRPGETSAVWRGVYRDDEMTGSRLMQKLPEDARKLIARYPSRPR